MYKRREMINGVQGEGMNCTYRSVPAITRPFQNRIDQLISILTDPYSARSSAPFLHI